ncbi:hypothetical protein ACJX0J_018134, partial [Zea mays]
HVAVSLCKHKDKSQDICGFLEPVSLYKRYMLVNYQDQNSVDGNLENMGQSCNLVNYNGT